MWWRYDRWVVLAAAGLFCAGLLVRTMAKEYISGKVWPEPKVIDPGDGSRPPSDAIVLFDGKDLSQWEGGEQWIVKDGVATSRGGDIRTKRGFGSCQLHVEWAAPEKIEGEGQGRGNSGVYLMSNYEVQILDSYNNKTYFDGQCAAIYKQYPPLVNACRKPGQWQTFDIIFTAPKFDSGRLVRPAYLTLLHNGVLVQNHTEILGTSAWDRPPAYTPHPDKLPIILQYHGNPVRFRNIWIREL
ncbi:MAG: 3-keto-disaccharide hydrolase [Thermoguttaceae bacterium]